MNSSMLHVVCGDCAAEQLRQSGLPGKVHVMHDPVCCGPMPDSDWYRTRAEWLVACGAPFQVDDLVKGLEREDAALANLTGFDDVVLWFDHCLFDQSILVRTLDRLANSPAKVSLICIGEFPGFARFKGLGELSPEQMASLWPQRHAVTAAEKQLASRAWAALRSPDPRPMEQLLGKDLTPLRYLRAALQRRLEELPSTRNGLNRTENAALAAIAAGKVTLPDIFRFVSDAEEAPFLGDTMLYWKLAELAQAKQPVIQVTGPGPIPLWETAGDMKAWTLSLTDTGRALLTGTADWLRLNGAETSWRWSEQTRQVEMS